MTSLELSAELKIGLERLKERDGVRVSEQIRRAVRAWLQAHGVEPDALKPETPPLPWQTLRRRQTNS